MSRPPFVHLHVHTNFSFGDGACRIHELVRAAAEAGMPADAITDHDGLYGAVFVRPFTSFARLNRDDAVDLIYGGLAWYSAGLSSLLTRTQSGRLRRYAIGIVAGVVIALGLVIWFKESP